MRFVQRTLAISLAALLLVNSASPVKACGPYFTEPVFVFEYSPDLPFDEYANGKIGIVLPTFGRKTLVIAYRYLNGGSFTSDEQTDLVAALKGKAPEDDGSAAVKAWVAARKEVLRDDSKLPEIYTERQHGEGYDFFPNCTSNAFEVATETLRDRANRYGPDDNNVRAWLATQDQVFQNCARGSQIPVELGAESPTWLRKDRDYQIAASYFYALNFDEARARFEKIATDVESPWQELSAYLVARTLVRQASLTGAEEKRRAGYERAEVYLQNFSANAGRFTRASQKLLALVSYHLHPEARVAELGRALASGYNENLRQDLIDYDWLLDKFKARILKAEEVRKGKAEPVAFSSEQVGELNEKLQRGELIQIDFYKGNEDQFVREEFSLTFKPDASDTEIVTAFEGEMHRKLSENEIKDLKRLHESALRDRQYNISPNRQWERMAESQAESYGGPDRELTFDLLPEFLHADDLTDWIFTVKTDDPGAYTHAYNKWRETNSHAWLAAAMIKASKTSRRLTTLLQAAEKITRDESSYATVAYHLVRLQIALGNETAARKLLDDVIAWQADVLPVSAQNQFLQQRMSLAENLTEFLKAAQRKPAAFKKYGSPGKISDLISSQKRAWNAEDYQESKEEWDQKVDREYQDMLPWDDRLTIDWATADVLNWHFPLQLLAKAARDPAVPDYLQGRLALAVWTRAILLGNDEVAMKVAPQALKLAPKMEAEFTQYLEARTPKKRHEAALYVLLKFPDLTPFLTGSIPGFDTSEDREYFFDTSWWCPLETTDYNAQGVEIPKVVPKPAFLTAAQLETARRERRALNDIGDAKSYLGQEVIAWAKSSPADPRVPEALFIAALANISYKDGCSGWDNDDRTREEAEKILLHRYASSPWAARLREFNKH